MEAAASNEDLVVIRLTSAADDLLSVVWDELECEVSKPKAAVIASTDSLRAKLVKKFGEYGGGGLLQHSG